MPKIYPSQIGLNIQLETYSDLTNAETVEILFLTPTGLSGVWTDVVVDGTTITYTTTSVDDLPVRGKYVLQAHAVGFLYDLSGEPTGYNYDLLGESAELTVNRLWS